MLQCVLFGCGCLIKCDLNSSGLDPHILFLCKRCVWLTHKESLLLCLHLDCMRDIYTLSHPHTLPLTHSSLTCSNPWICRAALKIKFLLQIIFLVIRKYTCSQGKECSDAMATWRLLTSPSSVSLVFGCFVFGALFLFHFIFRFLYLCTL